MRATRFDPAQLNATCPVCGTGVSTPAGEPVPPHQPQGSREGCSGAGQPGR